MANETASEEPKMGAASWGLIALALLVLAATGWRTIATADIWTHIAVGRDIVHHGIPHHATLTFALPPATPWVDTTWLYDVGTAALWKFGGAKLVTLAHIGSVVLAFLFLSVATVRRGASESWAVALAIAVAACLLIPLFSPGPMIASLIFPAAFLATLWRGSCWKLARVVLPVAQLLWTNIHPSFLFGPALAAMFAIDAWLEERRGNKPEIPATSLGLLAGTLLLLTLFNPYGFGLHTWLFKLWLDPLRNISLDASSAYAGEFTPTLLRYSPYAALAIIATGLVTIRQRLSVSFAGAAVFGAFLLVRSTILTPVSTALMFPFIAMSLTAAAAYAPGIARHARAISAVVLLALGALVASGKHLEQFGLTSHNGLGIQVDVFPVDAAAVVSRPAFPQHILSLASDGAFLATRLPAREIYCDTRGSLFGAGFYDRLARALVGDPKAMHEIEADCAPGAILLDCTWPMSGSAASALLAQGRWALAYFDGTTAILMRNTSENLQFLRDRRLQRSGLDKLEKARRAYVEKMDAPIGNANCARLVGAGNLYLALNQFREAEIVYRLLTQGTPRMHSAWLGLGIAQVQLGRHTDAIASLQHAVELRKKDPLALLWLSFAYHYAGKKADAEDAVARARALNADFTTAFLKNPPVRPPKS